MTHALLDIDAWAASMTDSKEVDICAGPGGWAQGSRILGRPAATGFELNVDACDTARANGFVRIKRDILTCDPADYIGITGATISTPCQSFSSSGKGSGRADVGVLLEAQTCVGMGYRSEYDLEEMGLHSEDDIQAGCGCMYDGLAAQVGDPRTALFIENIRWALTAPDLTWLALEEVPACEPLFEDIAAELYSAGWESANVVVLDAADYGAAAKRERVFLYANRYEPSRVSHLPREPIAPTTMAQALGWPKGVKVYTRGNRQTSGGNAYSADRPSWCLTKSARSWKIGSPDGPEMTAAQAGMLNGFPATYQWLGSRTSKFQRIADVVSPIMSAVILGCATNTEWEPAVRAYLDELYSPMSHILAEAAA